MAQGTHRTELAEDRTILANERTFAGWMRTGLAAVGIGLAFHAIFEKVEPAWVARAIASAFVVAGIVIFFVAERKACSVLSRMDAHEIEPIPRVNLRFVALTLSTGALLLLGAFWFLM